LSGASNGWGGGKLATFYLLRQYLKKTVRDSPNLLVITSRKLQSVLLIGTKVDDLWWPWTAIRSNFSVISQDSGDNNG